MSEALFQWIISVDETPWSAEEIQALRDMGYTDEQLADAGIDPL